MVRRRYYSFSRVCQHGKEIHSVSGIEVPAYDCLTRRAETGYHFWRSDGTNQLRDTALKNLAIT